MKKLILYQMINRFLYLMFSLAIPILIIVDKYDVAQNRTEYAVKGGGLILAFLLIKFGRFHFRRMLDRMKDGYLKRAIEQVFHLMPYGLIYLSIKFAETHLNGFKYVVKWAFASMLVAVIFDLLSVYLDKRIEAIK